MKGSMKRIHLSVRAVALAAELQYSVRGEYSRRPEPLTLALKGLQELESPLCPCAIHLEHGDRHNHEDDRSDKSKDT